MPLLLLITIYCGLIVAASLLGGWLPSIMRLSHTRMQLMMSGVGGLMLGVGVLHMLPHGLPQVGSLDWAVGALLAGIMTMFFLMRVFHAHEHVPVAEEYPVVAVEDHQAGGHQHCDHEEPHVYPPQAAHAHNHGHHHDHHHEPPGNRSTMRWLGIFLGLSLHTLIDGIALGAAVAAASSHLGEGFHLVGLGVFLGIVLHKPLDALSITFVMK
ncbi:MAG: ZIP family metal transporter, partial [Pirellulaceae bacterium]